MESVLPGGVGGALGGAGLSIPKFGAPDAAAPSNPQAAPSQPSGAVGLPPIGF